MKAVKGTFATGKQRVLPGPEIQLLLQCARTELDSERLDQIKTLLGQDINWSYLHDLAIQHQLRPLLHRNLKTFSKSIPQEYFSKLETDCFKTSAWNLQLTGELLQLIKLFEEHGIAAVPYKGPLLATTVYGSVALRVYSDLDLFVKKQDLLKIRNLLTSREYEMVRESAKQQDFHLKHKYNFSFTKGRTLIEIHWSFTRRYMPFPIDFDQLWERVQFVPFSGIQVRNFSPEDLLLLLCIHGAKHRWMRLGWLCDIGELIRVHPEMDWDYLINHANRIHVSRILFLGLILVHDLLHTKLPKQVLEQIQKDSGASSLAHSIRDWILTGSATVLEEEPVFYIKMRERLQDKIIAFLYYLRLDVSFKRKEKKFRALPLFWNYFVRSLYRQPAGPS